MAAMALAAIAAPAQTATQAEVLEAARNANDYFMAKYADPTEPTNVKKIRPSHLWTRAVYYEGLMALYSIDKNEAYIDYTDRWANFHKWTPRDGIGTRDADNQCCSQTYLERFVMTGDSAMLRPTRENLQGQMAETKIGYWTWIDAIQMAMPVYAQMYKITGDEAYNLCYWSRGNGWVLAALVRVIDQMKPKGKAYKELKKDFIMMCDALAKCQREDGFWNVSLASPATFGGKETSGTALFLYGISWGLRKGYLKEKTFRPVADKAWKAMATEALHKDGFLGYVQGTGKEPKDGQPVTYNKVPDFEDFGLGCFLLGAVEYYKLISGE